ncbi:dna mismatch repair protein msh6-like protein [Dermatophagoides farinae]|uniref:DNA mismatch repair protein n=1 Tax=Dermatophagoides farinae TaxID=6954 RepID=A0A9D4SI39_DERFA|nr:DNA mismatch repair protein Msh6-like [Dermatophagoides farinae]KAH7642757.1 dna mismatch repair protein msh6-like protein [Dermatophagoides farinae]
MKKSPFRGCQTPKQNNTLLNYFSRTTPKSVEKCDSTIQSKSKDDVSDKRIELSDRSNKSENNCKTATRNCLEKETPSKRKTEQRASDDDDDKIGLIKSNDSMQKNKRFKRIFLSSDDDDDDNENVSKNDGDDYQPETESSDVDFISENSDSNFGNDDDDEVTPPSKKSKKNCKSSSKNVKATKSNKYKKDADDFIFDDMIEISDDSQNLSNLKLKTKKILDTNSADSITTLKMNEDKSIAFKFIPVDPIVHEKDSVFDDENLAENANVANNEYAILDNEKIVKKSSYSSLSNVDKPTSSEQATNTQWPHLSYKFLQPKYIKDLNGNPMLINDELNVNYDPSTLYVPIEFLEQQTPAMRQWWELKSRNYDTILFFKMGKFYEFFHMDAVSCAKELKILFMRGNNAHAGFPEKSYKKYADALVQKGYKVARVEQTETPEMVTERCKKMKRTTKFDKVVKREICRISSIGTRYMSDIDADTFLDYTSYLMAFTCKEFTKSSFDLGVCFVDVSIGQFFLSQFRDDRNNSKLRTLISHYSPVEIIIEESNKLCKLIETICPAARVQKLKRFKSASQTLKFIYEKNLWSNIATDFRNEILDPSDVIQQSARTEFELATVSMGAIIDYLEKSLIIDDIMSMGQFQVYRPPEFNSVMTKLPDHMIMDSMTMKNLEILESLTHNDMSKTSTLFKIINHCQTAFGKRMLRTWICQPLCGLSNGLEMRREAVRDLAENIDIAGYHKHWKEMLKKIPDLDRLLTQIHSQSSLKRSKDHPDARAILFESDIYRIRRIKTFLDTIAGFEQISKIVENIQSNLDLFKSKYIHQLMTYIEDGGLFPRFDDKIQFFRQSFDEEKVRQDGHFIPDKGVDDEYDQACETISNITKKFDDYLNEQKLFFKTRINYVNALKNRFLLEVPDSCESKISKWQENYELKSSRKGYKRYHTTKLIEMIEQLEQAENEKQLLLGDIFRRLLARFDQDYKIWRQAISCISQFDALLSLSNTRQLFESNGSNSCLPEFIWDHQDQSIIRAKDLRNAFLVINNTVIPNDIELMGETLILTGPNMGGKTTLMRSVGLLVILAQIGSYVPASECQLTPVDRIFTRIGAYDIVLENESTFMVELSEALSIMKYASKLSLALIDELGSGTSTFDGTAIASAIIFNLAETIKCRTLFSTHYHSILGELNGKANIKLGYMSYMIENENDKDPTDENIVFLYKLQPGICNKSYGFNVAKLAGIPNEIIRRAHQHSQQFELECRIKSLLNWFQQRKKQHNKSMISDNDRVEAEENCQQLLSTIRMLRTFIGENNP